ncbi:MAG TPA: 3-oxo-tetronate 4-phosphate decarboxylase [Pyrinomonadaceae bacterium]|nr:3-oxo-tetronate 4-phosphate decarboxylase [Pyrinomonadaceae bacterium]
MDNSLLEQLCEMAASLFERGYAHGSTGNISLRLGDEVWITPTGQRLGSLTPARLARIDLHGNLLNDNRPSKEHPFHTAIYRQRDEARAIVHLHSLYAVALSCLESFEGESDLAPLTPYYFMRVAPLAVLPYYKPGSPDLARAIEGVAPAHHSMLLRNHGLICAGATLSEASDRAEELEQTARLHFILRGERVRPLSPADVEALR